VFAEAAGSMKAPSNSGLTSLGHARITATSRNRHRFAMTWKQLYKASLTQGGGASIELRERCLAAIEASASPALLRVKQDLSVSLYGLCEALDAVGIASISTVSVPIDPPATPASTSS
jgi:hypothetical protein